MQTVSEQIRQAVRKPFNKPIPPLLILIGITFIYLIARSWGLGLNQGVTDRLRFHAIPVAIGTLYHHLPHDYTSRKMVAQPFQDMSRPIEEKMESAINAEIPSDAEIYFWAADDKGMVDYVIAAFKLFGPKVVSLYRFYFLLLLASCAAFVVAFRRNPAMLALLVFTLCGIAAFASALPLVIQTLMALADAPQPQPPVGIFEPRILDVLAYVAVLHIALFAAKTKKFDLIGVMALLFQVVLFYFCYHARSSLGWQLLAIFFLTLVFAFRRLRRREASERPLAEYLLALLPVIVMLLGWSALYGYKHLTYHPRYFQDMGSRTIWHNALMGLGAADQGLAQKYHLEINDTVIAESVIKFAQEMNDSPVPKTWTARQAMISLGGYTDFDWQAYERYARSYYFEIVKAQPLRVLRAYLIRKPLSALGTLVRTMLPKGNDRLVEYRDKKGLYFSPFAYPLAVFVLIPIILVFGELVRANEETFAVVSLFVLSLIPSVAFYDAVLTMGGTFVSIALLAYLLLPKLADLVWRKYLLAP